MRGHARADAKVMNVLSILRVAEQELDRTQIFQFGGRSRSLWSIVAECSSVELNLLGFGRKLRCAQFRGRSVAVVVQDEPVYHAHEVAREAYSGSRDPGERLIGRKRRSTGIAPCPVVRVKRTSFKTFNSNLSASLYVPTCSPSDALRQDLSPSKWARAAPGHRA